MSGAAENRTWRRVGNPSQQQRQDRSSGSNTPTRQDGNRQSVSSFSGNAWSASERSRSGSATGDRARGGQQGAAQAEQHVPVKDFNATEVKEFLKKGYTEANAIGSDEKSPHYKPQGDSVPNRNSGVWGASKNLTHTMPNGQDFFVQLRKQVQSLEQTKSG